MVVRCRRLRPTRAKFHIATLSALHIESIVTPPRHRGPPSSQRHACFAVLASTALFPCASHRFCVPSCVLCPGCWEGLTMFQTTRPRSFDWAAASPVLIGAHCSNSEHTYFHLHDRIAAHQSLYLLSLSPDNLLCSQHPLFHGILSRITDSVAERNMLQCNSAQVFGRRFTKCNVERCINPEAYRRSQPAYRRSADLRRLQGTRCEGPSV
jgi:hypothetical protein